MIIYQKEYLVTAYSYAEHGKPQNGRIGIISNRQGEKWSRSIPFEVTHAFFLIENNGDGIDVKGIRPLAEIADDFSNSYFHSQYHPDDFRTRFMGNSDSKPLYGDQIDIRAAIKIILAHDQIFVYRKI